VRIEHVRDSSIDGGQGLLAVILSNDFWPMESGTNFVTPPELTQQIGLLCHKQGTRVLPHTHRESQRKAVRTLETLVVVRGRISVSVYTAAGALARTVELFPGDAILLCSGHAVEYLNDSEVIEVKQGPYTEDDKAPLHIIDI